MYEKKSTHTRYWTLVTYPENMLENWKDLCSGLLEMPYCYILHDKDVLTQEDLENDPWEGAESVGRKDHVHWIIVFPNTTTQNFATQFFDRLSKKGSKCYSGYAQPVANMRKLYDYLIHDTEEAKKLNKHLYDRSERIEGNNFDIGSYIQYSKLEKDEVLKEFINIIVTQNFTNLIDFTIYINSLPEYFENPIYFEVLKDYNALLARYLFDSYRKVKTSSKSKEE